MLKVVNIITNEYRLIIEYKGFEYSYIAKMIGYEIGEETWFVWTKKRILHLVYNRATKILTEDLQQGQPALPEDFMQVLQESFAARK